LADLGLHTCISYVDTIYPLYLHVNRYPDSLAFRCW
jgi:hypothetical protein